MSVIETTAFGRSSSSLPPILSSSLRRDPSAPPAGNIFVRMMTARAIGAAQKRDPVDVAVYRWPHDKLLAQLLARAAVAPAMTSVTGWAAELAQLKVVTDGLAALAAMSAGAILLKSGLVLTFDGAGVISVPGFVASAGNAGFVAEGAPIPVRRLNAVPATLVPHKLAAIGTLTREMMESSNAEQLIGDTLIRSAALALDAVLFDNVAADAARPAGLRNGIAALTPSNKPDTHDAFLEDIAGLMDAVSAVGGIGPYALVVSPGRFAGLAVNFIREITNLIMLGSANVGNDIIMIALPALVSAGADPEIETAIASALHMDDAPLPMGTAAPAQSMFQTETLAIKMRWQLTWTLRDPRGVAWMTPSWK